MFLKLSLPPTPKACSLASRQGGSALIIGIFVITVMFVLALSLINILKDADSALTQEVWGARALSAANSGADAALAQLFALEAPEGAVPSCATVANEWLAPDKVGFHACRVSISCTQTTVDTASQYLIRSKAVCESGATRVSRQVEVAARE